MRIYTDVLLKHPNDTTPANFLLSEIAPGPDWIGYSFDSKNVITDREVMETALEDSKQYVKAFHDMLVSDTDGLSELDATQWAMLRKVLVDKYMITSAIGELPVIDTAVWGEEPDFVYYLLASAEHSVAFKVWMHVEWPQMLSDDAKAMFSDMGMVSAAR